MSLIRAPARVRGSPRHAKPIPLLFFGGGDETLDDGSRFNPSVLSFLRDEWMYEQVHAR
jgi:hypothetical protein